jgi:transposase
MRGADQQPEALFSYVVPEQRVPGNHPLRPIRRMANEALKKLSPRFAKLYAASGRPSIPPEKLLRALLLQVLYSVRSERLLMEQLDYNLLFRWFVGLGMDDPIWDPTTFTKNRDRLLEGDIAQAFFQAVVEQIRDKKLLSDEHFSVDGTLLEAWASQKSFRPKDAPKPAPSDNDPGNPTVDFRGEKRTNETHRSTSDPDALLAKKGRGKEAKLSFAAHVVIENRNGIIVDTELTPAHGRAEEDAALLMAERLPGAQRVTLGGDKGYDDRELIRQLRGLDVTPHVAQNLKQPGGSALDGRTTRHAGYAVSQRKRKRVEEVFGWMKTVGLLRKLRHRGHEKVDWIFTFAAAAYNMVRSRTLLAAEAT